MRPSRRSTVAALASAAALAGVVPPPAASAAPPANDDFARATTLTPAPSLRLGTVAEATREAGEPEHAENATGASVWYRYVPRRSGPVSLSTCSTRFDTVLGVYTGDSLGALTQVASDDDSCINNLGSRVTFVAQRGQVYRIAVGSFEPLAASEAGRFHLVATEIRRPRNDNFRSAQTIRLRQRAILNTELARRQRGERGHHADNPAGRSVWFKFTPRRTQRVRLSTHASSFDTIASVYEGSRLSRLRRVVSNDDARGETFATRLSFRAVAGRTYRIAVDGYQRDSGDLVVRLHR